MFNLLIQYHFHLITQEKIIAVYRIKSDGKFSGWLQWGFINTSINNVEEC